MDGGYRDPLVEHHLYRQGTVQSPREERHGVVFPFRHILSSCFAGKEVPPVFPFGNTLDHNPRFVHAINKA